jgi:hypothetical protein
VSKQALHRRLSARGEDIYERTVERTPTLWLFNPSVVAQIARLGAAELEKRAEQP